MNITQQLFVSPVEGEVIHIYCDGRDITSQAWNDEDEDYQLTLERADHTYTILIEDAPDANPTWTILQGDGMTGSQVIVKRKGVDEVTILDDAATTMTIDDVGVEKVTLKVPLGPMQPVETYKIRLVSVTSPTAVQLYLQSFFGMGKARVTNLLGSLPAIIPNKTFATEAEAQNVVDELASKGGTAEIVPGLYGASQPVPNNLPIRVLRNGAEFTSQMTFGDPLYAICEVPFATLTDATWEVGFDTSRRQIFYRKGGSMMSDIQYEIYYNDPIVEIPKDLITIVDLPAYGEPNGNLQLNIPVADNEKLTVYRNNVDVTEKFDYDVEEGYRNYFHNGGNVTDLYSITNWGFNTREAATWQIEIKITKIFLEAYVGGGTLVKQRIMPNGDIESEGGGQNYSGHWIKDGEGVRILFIPDANGAKLKSLVLGTTALDLENESRLELQSDGIYVFTLTAEQVAELRTANENIQVFAEFEKPNTIDFSFVGDFYLVSYKSDYEMELDDSPRSGESFEMSNITGSNFQQITEGTDLDGYLAQLHFKPKDSNATIRVYRNGEELTESIQTTYQQAGVLNYYYLEGSDSSWHSPASWVIIADDGSNQPGVNYMFIGNYNYVTAYADYNEGYEYEGSQFHAENVEGYCVGKVIENGSCINEEMGMDIQMQNANDTFRAFRNGVDMTSQFSKGDGNIWTFTSRDATMHEPAQWIIVADNDLSRYDTNRDGEITIADVTKLVNKVLKRE